MLLICGLAWYFLWRPFPVDSAIPHYTKVDNLNGNLVSVGSDTLADVMVLGSQQFQKLYPNVTMHLEHSGSGTAPTALTGGRSQLAPMSRVMTDEEIGAFQAKYGYKPTAYRVALDALAIYVNKDNPFGADSATGRWDLLEHAQARWSLAGDLGRCWAIGRLDQSGDHPVWPRQRLGNT